MNDETSTLQPSHQSLRVDTADSSTLDSMPSPLDSQQTNRRRGPLAAVVICVALAGLALAWHFDRLDSALLFVGVPCLLAYGVGLLPGANTFARVMQATTIVLLLASALLHEGAFCMVLAAPILYGAAAAGWWLTTKRRTQHALALPLLMLLATEGITPGARVLPHGTAEATTSVPVSCETAVARLGASASVGELPSTALPSVLRVAPYRPPLALSGSGFEQGSRWSLATKHGAFVTSVERQDSSSVRFNVVEDTTHLAANVTITGGTLAWEPTAEGCLLRATVDYDRKLDPGVWFGPVTDVFMSAGVEAFAGVLASVAGGDA